MVYIEDTVAAATAAVGYNLAQGKYYQTAARLRRIVAFGLTGSVNPGYTAVEIFYGTTKIAEVRNSAGGANVTPKKDDMKVLNSDLMAEPGEPLNLLVKVAPGTNALFWAFDLEEI